MRKNRIINITKIDVIDKYHRLYFKRLKHHIKLAINKIDSNRT